MTNEKDKKIPEPPSDEPPLTPEERAELRAILRDAHRQDAGLRLVQSVEYDLAGQGALGPDDYVDLKVDENGDYIAHIVRAGSNEEKKGPEDE